ncbi:hypothetical protein D922_02416 [Enterococcus faecalis 06-MB-DW-09]|nr:hypothetical protein D922_02416 [Enterococcus faecalis 06-MB-DW-09]
MSPKKYSRDDVGKMGAAEINKAVEEAKQGWEKNIPKEAEDKGASDQNQSGKSVQEKLAQKEAELAKKEICLEYREKEQEEGLPLKIIFMSFGHVKRCKTIKQSYLTRKKERIFMKLLITVLKMRSTLTLIQKNLMNASNYRSNIL